MAVKMELNWTPRASGSKLAAMSKAMPARRVVALIAAYVVALQALLLPLSLATAGPAQLSLCSEASTGTPAQHNSGCPCAAGCGMQCCAQVFVGPPYIAVAYLPAHAIVVDAPSALGSIVRIAQRTPQIPRAPPAA